MADPSLSNFGDLLRLWRVDPVGHSDALLEAAALLMADGSAGPAVEALVADGPESSRSGFERLVSAVEVETSVETLSGTDLQDRAVSAMAKRFLTGLVSAREFTYWVTRVVGLRGSRRTQVFLDLEQEYCARLGDADVSDLDAAVLSGAQAFVAHADVPLADADRGKSGLRGLVGRWKRRGRP